MTIALHLKINVKYAWARLMQASKMIKRSMTMFFTNSDLALMWEHLNYKNVDKIRALLIELPYDKIIWWAKSLNIASVTADVVPKKYLIYNLDIIPAIQLLIGY